MAFRGKQVSVILLAAGSGNRMKASKNKLFLPINNIPILYRTLHRLNQIQLIDSIILVCKNTDKGQIEKLISKYGEIQKVRSMIAGGKERSDSVNCGLEEVRSIQPDGIVMTHDGARPFISETLVKRLVESSSEESISIPSLKVIETVRKQKPDGLTAVVDRQHLFTVQTPQVFHVKHIQQCFLNTDKAMLKLTDEASYFEASGKKVTLVEGEKWNIKLTTPEDILWAEYLLHQHNQLKLTGLEN